MYDDSIPPYGPAPPDNHIGCGSLIIAAILVVALMKACGLA